MTDIIMDNRTNKIVSSRNKRKVIFNNIMRVMTILLLIAAVVIAAMVLTSCSEEPTTFPEAEAQVAAELEALKTTDDAGVMKAISEVKDEKEIIALGDYMDKLRDFDYEIIGSQKSQSGEKGAADVLVTIKTYDFGTVYMDCWERYLKDTEEGYYQTEEQFNIDLLTRLSSLNSKDVTAKLMITCTDTDGDGQWETNIGPDNVVLMDALSGGMISIIDAISQEEEATD